MIHQAEYLSSPAFQQAVDEASMQKVEEASTSAFERGFRTGYARLVSLGLLAPGMIPSDADIRHAQSPPSGGGSTPPPANNINPAEGSHTTIPEQAVAVGLQTGVGEASPSAIIPPASVPPAGQADPSGPQA